MKFFTRTRVLCMRAMCFDTVRRLMRRQMCRPQLWNRRLLMNNSKRGLTVGSVLIGLLLLVTVAFLAVLLLDSFDKDDGQQTDKLTAEEESALLESAENAGYPPADTGRYYHRPVLIAADSTQTGVSAAVWKGLCQYLDTEERTEACYTAEDSPQALTDAIDQAEADIVPNLVLLTGSAAPEAAAEAQTAYAGTFFVVIDGALDAPTANTCCVTFATEQAGFLAGYAAVMDGFTRLHFAAETEDSETALYRSGFLQGADRAAQSLDVEVWITTAVCGSDAPVFDNDAEVAFVCGGTAFQEAAVAEAEREQRKIICSGIDYSYLYQSRTEGTSPILSSAVKNYTAVTQSLLTAFDNGAWDQFYGGQVLRYDLSWGETVCLTTGADGWHFTRFSAEQYYQILGNLRNDPDYAVSAEAPTLSAKVHLNQE